MSLILDALKKLDREKDAREPGVLVVGSVPWGGGPRSRRPLALALGAVGLVALVAVGWWLLRPTPRPVAASPVPTVAPATSPVTTPVATPVTAAPTAAPASPPAPPATAPAAIAPPLRPPLTVAPPSSAGAEAAAPAETRPPATAPRPAGDLQLNAITRRDGRAVALINDRLVFEGDSFDGVKVLRIGEDEVEVEVRGQRRVLRF